MTDHDELLVFSPTFHPEKVGTPHYATDMVRALADQGHAIRVVTNQPYYPAFRRFPGYGRQTRSDQLDGIPVHRLPTMVPRGGGRLARMASEANMLLQAALALALRRLAPMAHVIAVSPGVPFAIVAGLILRRRGGRLTVVVHDVGFGLAHSTGGRLGGLVAGAIRRVEVAALNGADRVTVLSDSMGGELQAAGVTSPIETVPPWPTITGLEGRRGRPGLSVQYSGNLGRKQGVHSLLDLADVLAVDQPTARVVIRGNGSERRSLEAEANRRGLANVDFQDFVPVERLVEGLAEGRVHVVPQLPEGAAFAVPSKVVNILAIGRPVVVTAEESTPLAALANECDAVLRVPSGDAAAFAAAVMDVLALDEGAYDRLCHAATAWAAQHDRDAAVRRIVGG